MREILVNWERDETVKDLFLSTNSDIIELSYRNNKNDHQIYELTNWPIEFWRQMIKRRQM